MDSLYDLVPPEWMAVIGAAFVVLMALRSLVAALIPLLTAIDVALDGRVDWHWVGAMANGLAWFDRLLDRLPVKPPFVRSKKR